MGVQWGWFTIVLLGLWAVSVTAQFVELAPPLVELAPPLVELAPPLVELENERMEDEKVAEEVAEEDRKEEKNRAFGMGYLAMAPKIMCAGSREKIFISFVNFSQPVDVTLAIMENEELTIASTPLEVFKTPCGCMELDLPNIDEPRKVVTLYMYAKRSLLQCDDFEIVDSIKIYLDACNSQTFIETDKSIYRAGQRVHFRVLTLLSDLRPDLSVVSKIWIETPSGVHVAQWLEVESEDGLIDLSMPMSTDPPLGDWKITVRHHAREITKTFEVSEYVLPKFEVLIETPAYQLSPVFDFELVICGRYTNGQPVFGYVSFKFWVSTEYKPQSTEKKFDHLETDENGCYTRTISYEPSPAFYSVYDARLIFNVEFEDKATRQVIVKTTDHTVISQTPFNIRISAPVTFKPGLPYSGMVKFMDPSGKPAIAMTTNINAVTDNGTTILNESVMSNINGVAYFTILSIPKTTKRFTVKAGEKGEQQSQQVEAQFSPSQSFIQMDTFVEPASVHSYVKVNIHMSSENPEYDGVYLHTVMMSRGNILLAVDTIIAPEDIDCFSQPGKYGVYKISTDKLGMKEYTHRKNMRANDIPIHIVKKGEVKTTRRKFKISYEMSPAVTLMVYYIRKNGEVVADTITIPVEETFQNQVTLNFADDVREPGQSSSLNIHAKPLSLCAYGVVDKSVHLLGSDYRITKEQVFQALEDLQLSAEGGAAQPNRRCVSQMFQGQRGFSPDFYPQVPVPTDASGAFKDLGVVYLTNLKVETAPCPDIPQYPVFRRFEAFMDFDVAMPMALALPPGAQEASVVPEVRSYFPETWLFSLVRVNNDGRANIDVQLPHTITEWIGHGFCTSYHFGAGVADLTSIRAFQPFFIDMKLLYSVIRNELVPVKVVVFNYVTKCLAVELTLQPSEDFETDSQEGRKVVCVCSNMATSTSFYIKTTQLGTIQIEVHAVSVQDTGNVCEDNEMDTSHKGFSDGIRKELLVKPEGVEQEQVFSVYFCPNDYEEGAYKEIINLGDLPKNAVFGSERAIVTVTGDILGPTINNLDHLLRIPSGCGEQNMIGFVPNIFVMHYLTGIGTLSPATASAAKDNMEIGYQRELNYVHSDGSYSAFGESDPSGSTWLTAFVVRSFSQASHFISIDKNDLHRSREWLLLQQRKDGCFEIRGRVIHKDMMGKVDEPITLTAYVVISLIESGMDADSEPFQLAIECISQYIDIQTTDTYTLSLAGYAYVLTGNLEKDSLLKRVLELAVETDDGLLHWEGRPEPVADESSSYLHHQASSQNIEITAYNLLTAISYYGRTEAIIFGKPVARWLVEQFNANGGFSSTQDTVMALQALAEYATMAYSGGALDISLSVKFSCEPTAHWLYLHDHNRFLLQTLVVPQVPVQVTMDASGDGCAMTQVVTTFNVHPEEPAHPPFSISFNTRETPSSDPAPCSSYEVEVCSSYTGPDDASNMVVLTIRIVSGFELSEESFHRLKDPTVAGHSFKRIEIDNEDVIFYFEELDDSVKCVNFEVVRTTIIEEPRSGVITIFDYYDKALSVSETYEFECNVQG